MATEPKPSASEWLSAWEAKGGGWTVVGGAPVLCCRVFGAPPGVSISDAMEDLDRTGLRDAVMAEILRRTNHQVES